MTDHDRAQVNERVEKLVDWWPTLTEAFGCVDCGFIYRVTIDGRCPSCCSQSVIELAQFFNQHPTAEAGE